MKAALLQGKSARQALKDANYSPNTAHLSTTNTIVKLCNTEILQDFKISNVTPENVLKNLHQDRELALKRGDLTNLIRVDELLGKYLSMFTERKETTIKIEYSQAEIDEYHRLKELLPTGNMQLIEAKQNI